VWRAPSWQEIEAEEGVESLNRLNRQSVNCFHPLRSVHILSETLENKGNRGTKPREMVQKWFPILWGQSPTCGTVNQEIDAEERADGSRLHLCSLLSWGVLGVP